MTGAWALCMMFLTVAVAAWSVGVLLSTAAQRLLIPTLGAPQARLRWMAVSAALPCLLPAAWVAALGLIALSKPAGWLDDHCQSHGGIHTHLCFEHFPDLMIAPLVLVLLGLLLLVPISLIARSIGAALQRRRRLRSLLSLLPSGGLIRRIDFGQPLALVARPFKPVVVISRSLLDGLGRRERRVVLAHEAAHLRQKDLFKTALFETLLALHWPPSASRLRALWHQAIEERADDCVARQFGTLDTASVLIKVVRQQRSLAFGGLAVSGAGVTRRIERLIEGPEPTDSRPPSLAGWALLAVLLGTAWPLAAEHHAVETFLSRILSG